MLVVLVRPRLIGQSATDVIGHDAAVRFAQRAHQVAVVEAPRRVAVEHHHRIAAPLIQVAHAQPAPRRDSWRVRVEFGSGVGERRCVFVGRRGGWCEVVGALDQSRRGEGVKGEVRIRIPARSAESRVSGSSGYHPFRPLATSLSLPEEITIPDRASSNSTRCRYRGTRRGRRAGGTRAPPQWPR